MNADDLHEIAKTNLTETYLALGQATNDVETLDMPGVVGCRGKFPHPICNFAITQSGSNAAVEDLRTLAQAHPGFHVYVCVASGCRSTGPLLLRAGFRLVHNLVQMLADPAEEAVPMPIDAAETLEGRRKIARFMMSQFFSRHPDWIRDRVCEATACAHGLDLYAVQAGRELLGAVMLRPSERSVGLYNLCVAAMERGRGHGSEIVRMVLRHAAVSRLPVILQCDRDLERWYSGFGFRAVGSIEVYAQAPSAR